MRAVRVDTAPGNQPSRDRSRPPQGELLQGTLPLLILCTLATRPNHGFAIARRIQQISTSVLRIEQGSLYPALHRMQLDGLIDSYWDTTENNRTAKYYRLTRRGTRVLSGVGLAAVFRPAPMAARIDPAALLRHD